MNTSEQLQQVISDSIDQKISTLKFDTTMQGTITQILDTSINQYRATIQGESLVVYGINGTTYEVGDVVNISIPNGDLSSTKTIISKVVNTSNESAVQVVDPLEGISQVGPAFESLCGFSSATAILTPTTDNIETQSNIWSVSSADTHEEIITTSQQYNNIMIAASFINYFSASNTVSRGNFGIHISFSCLYHSKYTTLETDFDSHELVGTPYAISTAEPQYKFITIPYGYTITGVEKIYLYQKGNFEGTIDTDDWIQVQDIHLSFVDGEAIRNNELDVQLSTTNGTYFSEATETINFKVTVTPTTLNMTYYWFSEDASIIDYNDENYNEYGGLGWRFLEATTVASYVASVCENFRQNNYKVVAVTTGGQAYTSNEVTLYKSLVDKITLTYTIKKKVLDFVLNNLDNEIKKYSFYWRKEDSLKNDITDFHFQNVTTISDDYDNIQSRAFYYVSIIDDEGDVVFSSHKTIITADNSGAAISNFSGSLLHHYDANGALSADAADTIYSLTAEMGGDFVLEGEWELPDGVTLPYQADDSLLILESIDLDTIYYTLASTYDSSKMNNTLTYILNGVRYSQYITIIKDGDNGTNGTEYTAKIFRTTRSNDCLWFNGSEWTQDNYEVQVAVYKSGQPYYDYEVKKWLIPKTRSEVNSIMTLDNGAVDFDIRFTRYDYDGRQTTNSNWYKAVVNASISNSMGLSCEWVLAGTTIGTEDSCECEILATESKTLQCIVSNADSVVNTFEQELDADAVDNSNTSISDSAISYYHRSVNLTEVGKTLVAYASGGLYDILSAYQNVIEVEVAITDSYSIYAYHAVPVCYGAEKVLIDEINSTIVYASDGVNPSYAPFTVSSDADLTYSVMGQASIDGTTYTPARKFLYDEGMPAIVGTTADSSCFCVMPVVTILNSYGLSYLNMWDGTSIDIDEDGGHVLAPQVGAGTKEDDNSFSGVLMGQLQGVTGYSGLVGLYGFDHGQASYGFLQDGTAFIGKSGLGQIIFDGNQSTIMSGNYQKNKLGMKLDLLNGTIDASGFNIDEEGNASFNGTVEADEGRFGPLVLSDGSITYDTSYGSFDSFDSIDSIDINEIAKTLVNDKFANGLYFDSSGKLYIKSSALAGDIVFANNALKVGYDENLYIKVESEDIFDSSTTYYTYNSTNTPPFTSVSITSFADNITYYTKGGYNFTVDSEGNVQTHGITRFYSPNSSDSTSYMEVGSNGIIFSSDVKEQLKGDAGADGQDGEDGRDGTNSDQITIYCYSSVFYTSIDTTTEACDPDKTYYIYNNGYEKKTGISAFEEDTPYYTQIDTPLKPLHDPWYYDFDENIHYDINTENMAEEDPESFTSFSDNRYYDDNHNNPTWYFNKQNSLLEIPEWIMCAVAHGTDSVDILEMSDFSDPVCNSQVKSATIDLFIAASSTPSNPTFSSSTTYNFVTGVLDPLPSGWSQTEPDLEDDENIYKISKYVTGIDSITISGGFSNPVIVNGRSGKDGDPGDNGYSYYSLAVYKSDDTGATALDTPNPAQSYTYEVSSNTLKLDGSSTTEIDGWSIEELIPDTSNTIWKAVYPLSSSDGFSTAVTIPAGSTGWAAPYLYKNKVVNGTPGSSGDNGYNTAIITLYAGSTTNSVPDWPTSGATTYTFSNTTPLSTYPTNWSTTMPTTEYVWARYATARESLNTDTVYYSEFTSPVRINGVDGEDATTVATIYLYQRSTSTSMSAPNNTWTYTFKQSNTSPSLTCTTSESWSASIPSGSDPCWVTQATAAAVLTNGTTTDDIEPGEWSKPVILTENGEIGPSGYNSAVVTLYASTSTQEAPTWEAYGSETDPNIVKYTFSSKNTSIQEDIYIDESKTTKFNTVWYSNTNWTPTPSYIWAVYGAASSQSATDNIPFSEFTSPVRLTGEQGEQGLSGDITGIAYLYTRDSTAASTAPSGSWQYIFRSDATTNPKKGLYYYSKKDDNTFEWLESSNSWSTTIPSTENNSNPCWVSQAIVSTQMSATGKLIDNSITEWSVPVKFAENGADGNKSAIVTLYKGFDTSDTVSKPTEGTIFYDFDDLEPDDSYYDSSATTNTIASWSTSIPSNDYVWAIYGHANSGDVDGIGASQFTDPIRITGVDGDPGKNGTSVAPVYLYQKTDATISSLTIDKSKEIWKYDFNETDPSKRLVFVSTPSYTSSSWQIELPAHEKEKKRWVTHATAAATPDSSGNIIDYSITEWDTPVLYNEDGVDGADGDNYAEVKLYASSSTAITTFSPTTTFTYYFATKDADGNKVKGYLDPPGSGSTSVTIGGTTWYIEPPASSYACYMCYAIAAGTGTTDTIDSWVGPTLYIPGNQQSVSLYTRADSTPSKPTTTATYNFTDTKFSVPVNNIWYNLTDISSSVTGRNYYKVTAIAGYSGSEIDTIESGEWSDPIACDEKGNPTSIQRDEVPIYCRVARDAAAPVLSSGSTYFFDHVYAPLPYKSENATFCLTSNSTPSTTTVTGSDGNTWYFKDPGTGTNKEVCYKAVAMAVGVGTSDEIKCSEFASNIAPFVQDGTPGDTGSAGRSVKEIKNYYAISSYSSGITNSSTTDSTSSIDSNWSTSVVVPNATCPYLWNYEEITYENSNGSSTSTSTSACIIGNYSKDGRGISEVQEWWTASSSSTLTTSEINNSSSTTIPTLNNDDHKYLWNNEKILYTAAPLSSETGWHMVGASGKSMKNYTNHYSLTTTSDTPSTPTTTASDWSTTFIPPTSSMQYLWNYERIEYSDNTYSRSTPFILEHYSHDMISIDEYWYLTTSGTAPSSTETGTKSDTPLPITSTNRFLWNKEIKHYVTEPTIATVDWHLAAVYGEKGTSGAGIKTVDSSFVATNTSDSTPTSGWDEYATAKESFNVSYPYLWEKDEYYTTTDITDATPVATLTKVSEVYNRGDLVEEHRYAKVSNTAPLTPHTSTTRELTYSLNNNEFTYSWDETYPTSLEVTEAVWRETTQYYKLEPSAKTYTYTLVQAAKISVKTTIADLVASSSFGCFGVGEDGDIAVHASYVVGSYVVGTDDLLAGLFSYKDSNSQTQEDYHYQVDHDGNMTIQDSSAVTNFKVTNQGYLTANSVSITSGAITNSGCQIKANGDIETSGNIVASGNMTIGDTSGNYLQYDKNSGKLTVNGSGTFSGSLSAAEGTFKGDISGASGTFTGGLNVGSGTFSVTTAGHLTATSAKIGGTNNYLEYSSNTLTISGGSISNGSCTITSSGTISTDGDIIASGSLEIGNDNCLMKFVPGSSTLTLGPKTSAFLTCTPSGLSIIGSGTFTGALNIGTYSLTSNNTTVSSTISTIIDSDGTIKASPFGVLSGESGFTGHLFTAGNNSLTIGHPSATSDLNLYGNFNTYSKKTDTSGNYTPVGRFGYINGSTDGQSTEGVGLAYGTPTYNDNDATEFEGGYFVATSAGARFGYENDVCFVATDWEGGYYIDYKTMIYGPPNASKGNYQDGYPCRFTLGMSNDSTVNQTDDNYVALNPHFYKTVYNSVSSTSVTDQNYTDYFIKQDGTSVFNHPTSIYVSATEYDSSITYYEKSVTKSHDTGKIHLGNATHIFGAVYTSQIANPNSITVSAPTSITLSTSKIYNSNSTVLHSSDRKLKTNIEEISNFGNVYQLKPVQYNFKSDLDQLRFGFIAQDVQELYPNLVAENEETLCLNYNDIIALNTAAIQEQKKEIDSLKQEITELKELIKTKL